MIRLCRQVVGAPAGALLNGDEHECGRPAPLLVLRAGRTITHVCTRHAIRFRRMKGYEVKEETHV